MADLHPENDTFPGEVYMGLAADVLGVAGIDPARPISLEDFTSHYLPEVFFKGKQNRRIAYAIFTSAAVRAGLEPDLLEELSWWPDDYWSYALYAAVGLIRAAADHTDASIADLVTQLADRHYIDLT